MKIAQFKLTCVVVVHAICVVLACEKRDFRKRDGNLAASCPRDVTARFFAGALSYINLLNKREAVDYNFKLY